MVLLVPFDGEFVSSRPKGESYSFLYLWVGKDCSLSWAVWAGEGSGLVSCRGGWEPWLGLKRCSSAVYLWVLELWSKACPASEGALCDLC